MKGLQGISTTVLHVCRSRIWASVVIHSVALYLIWLCIKCQTSKSSQFKLWLNFKTNVFHQCSPGQQPPWKSAQEGDEGSERIKLTAGAEHPKISPWVAVKTCISAVTFCSQTILCCPTRSHPRTPKGEQAWTGRDEYLLPGTGYLKCSSLLGAIHAALQLFQQRFPEKKTQNSQSTQYSWRPKGSWKTQPERSWSPGFFFYPLQHHFAWLKTVYSLYLQISFHLSREFIPIFREFFMN